MTREVMDTIPTGRNIQAIGIMIPGTSLALGGGGALSRDVGGSGNLQQSPLQYRGSGDTVQTIEGLRLNNLCAQGAYSGVYWNDGSFQEISYVTGADSAEMGQGGMRVNMVPEGRWQLVQGHRLRQLRRWWRRQLGCAGNLPQQPRRRPDLQPEQPSHQRRHIDKVWDFNPSIGGPIKRDRIWFNYTFRHWGVNKSVADSYFDRSLAVHLRADLTRPGSTMGTS